MPRRNHHDLLLALWAAFASAQSTYSDLPPSSPLPTRSPADGPLFRNLSAETTGVRLVHEFPPQAPLVLMQEQGAGAGIGIGDFDGDSLADLAFTHPTLGCRLYRNLGGWRFADVSERAGIHARGHWGAGVAFADIDNDSDLDLFVGCFQSTNLVFINQGDGTFTNRTDVLGLAWSGSTVMGAFGDYDRDGRLDLYVLTHRNALSPHQALPSGMGEALRRGTLIRTANGRLQVSDRDRGLFELVPKSDGRADLAIAGESDLLFHQKPDGTFEDMTAKSGIRGNDIGLGVSWWDYDDDGWPDLYVANDHKTPDRLWRNQRDGTFREVTAEALPHVPFASMGTDVADVNNDGRLDLLATDMAASSRFRRMSTDQGFERNRWYFQVAPTRQYPRNALFLGTGLPRVFEVAFLAGVAETDWTWSPKWADFDNDGWVDLFIANGMSRDFLNGDLLSEPRPAAGSLTSAWQTRPPLKEANLAFQNRGDLSFASRGLDWGLDRLSASFGAATGDLDNDGDLDLVVVNLGEAPSLFENQEATHHRLVVRLDGRRSHRSGIGAKAIASSIHGDQAACITPTSGFMSSNEPVLHFGLGKQRALPRLRIDWPSGASQVFENLPADRLYTITEPDHADSPPSRKSPLPWFDVVPIPEVEFRAPDDPTSALEPSLPWRPTSSTPCIALGDADGDGDIDLFRGGTPTLPPIIAYSEPDGRLRVAPYARTKSPPFVTDLAAIFLDSDGDDRLDLFVSASEAAAPSATSKATDRVALNSDGGNWTETASSPAGQSTPSRVAAAADFDRDGDLDLFVGGGSVPGEYPRPAASRLLRQDKNRWIDATDAAAPDLATTGRVTSAVWTDVDNDGWIDLVISREWDSLILYRNDQGRRLMESRNSGLARRRGLWQCVAAGDLDGDGDMDLIAGNFGTNSRYSAVEHGPVRLTRADLWNTGRIQLLETYEENGVRFPFRHRALLLQEAPFLIERFPTFESMARANLATLLGRDDDLRTNSVEIDTVASGIWINDGNGTFEFKALPTLAQAAPVFAIAIEDFDGDLLPDVALGQNLRGAHLETGPLDGSMGLILRGTPEGGLTPLPPDRSGFVAPDESRFLAVDDTNNDGFPDLLLGSRNGRLLSFRNTQDRSNSPIVPFTVRLRGRIGNRAAIGSRVEVLFQNGRRRVEEIFSSQGGSVRTGSTLHFQHPPTNTPTEIKVRWPDGAVSTHRPAPESQRLDLQQH